MDEGAAFRAVLATHWGGPGAHGDGDTGAMQEGSRHGVMA